VRRDLLLAAPCPALPHPSSRPGHLSGRRHWPARAPSVSSRTGREARSGICNRERAMPESIEVPALPRSRSLGRDDTGRRRWVLASSARTSGCRRLPPHSSGGMSVRRTSDDNRFAHLPARRAPGQCAACGAQRLRRRGAGHQPGCRGQVAERRLSGAPACWCCAASSPPRCCLPWPACTGPRDRHAASALASRGAARPHHVLGLSDVRHGDRGHADRRCGGDLFHLAAVRRRARRPDARRERWPSSAGSPSWQASSASSS
jgi:hypothetical protein